MLVSVRYTARGRLVGVITNGTSVLGLGDVGAAAAKPVMEVLFKCCVRAALFPALPDTTHFVVRACVCACVTGYLCIAERDGRCGLV